MKEHTPLRKRNRPLSSCFDVDYDSPSIRHLLPQSSDDETPSPLLERKPFRNLANLPTSMKKLSMRSLKSVSQVAKSSSHFFRKEEERPEGERPGQDTQVQEDSNDLDIYSYYDKGYEKGEYYTETFMDDALYRPIRRIQSMFETQQCSSLLTFSSDADLLPRISASTLTQVLGGDYAHDFEDYLIIDCRFSYEYEGGHVMGARNVQTKEELERLFHEHTPRKRTLVIFHCEFSVFRGPSMASHLRKIDREANRDAYPHLTYPDVVVLEGGYCGFYQKYRHLCVPQGYVEMKDENYEHHCELKMNQIRQENKLTRAKSYDRSWASTRPYDKNHKRQKSTSMLENLTNEKFQPPSASFKHKSAQSTSVFSLPASLNSSDTGFSSQESLAAYSSPVALDFSDYFDTPSVKKTSLLKPVSRKPSGPLPQVPGRKIQSQSPAYKFPLKNKGSRHSLNRISTASRSSMTPGMNSSPITNSPSLSETPMSTFDSSLSTHASSIIDPINDTPVDFVVPSGSRRYHSRKVSGSLLSSAGGGLYNLDIEEE